MPYKYGHYWVGFVLAMILLGFWPSYFLQVAAPIPPAFHVHAFTATSWVLLLIVQSVAIHRRNNALHRTMGKASFVLFPLLILGFVMIVNLSASRYAAEESGFAIMLGPSFGIGMATSIAAYLVLYYQALKHRGNVRLHAGYMLATPAILFESPFSRVIQNNLPWMNAIGSEGPQAVLDVIVISNALVLAVVAWLYLRDRKHGAPWLVTAFFLVLQSVVMWYANAIPGVPAAFGLYAQIPQSLTTALGLFAGVVVTWLGWQKGMRGRSPREGAQPA